MNLSASKVLSAAVVTGALVCTMVATAFAAELSSGVGTVTASALKLRAEASTTSACLTLLPKGTSVVVEDDSIAGWYKVNHEGVTGYLSSEYVSFSISGSAKLGNGKVTGNDVNVRSAASSKGSEIVAYAKQYLGVKYVYAGASSKGFDCSGYTMYVMKHFGYNLPHTATGQMGYGTSVAKSALQPGDLVFFCDPSRSGGKAASHVGIYIGSNQFIHASSGGGKVQIDSLSKAYYAKYYVGARRLAN